MAYQNPSVQEFKDYFSRDFPYNADPALGVTDADILKCFGQSNMGINQGVFTDQSNYTIGYMFLAAHWLVFDLRASSQGMQGTFGWITQSKSVGNVSVSYAIPQWIMDNPYFAALNTTTYGSKYLMLLMPYMVGAIFTVPGSTRP